MNVQWMAARATGVSRWAAAAVLTVSLAGCGSFQNMVPDFAAFRLPDRSTFVPTRATFNYNISPTTAVTAADLVDAQGQCTAPAAAEQGHGVRLDMTECEVVRTLGQPQSIDFPQADQRRVVLIYHGGERPGIYEFTAGRLTAVERSGDPPASPAPARKKKASAPPPA